MRALLVSFGRALLSQLRLRMLLLTILPFVMSVVIWGVALSFWLQPAIDWLQAYFTDNNGFSTAGQVLGWLGLGAFKTVMVPLIAMWVLLPLMIVTAILFVGTLAMPIIVRHVAGSRYPELERRKGGSIWGGLWVALSSFLMYAGLWLITLPLSLFPPLTFVVQPLLWGWLTYRVMAYDALAEHASGQEYRDIVRIHRWPLLTIGAATGVMGAAPSLLWLGGALSVIFFPVLAAGAIWLYVLVFVFTGLWFQYYCMQALAEYRASAEIRPALKDIN